MACETLCHLAVVYLMKLSVTATIHHVTVGRLMNKLIGKDTTQLKVLQ